jgi:hypothetical protein
LESRYDAYCGLYCGGCTAFLATKENNVATLAREWNMEENDVKCLGCKSQTTAKFCTVCPLKECARDKGLEFCGECREYPCQKLEGFRNAEKFPYHSEVYDNLAEIKKQGLQNWLKHMKKRWSCPSCGKEFSWYTQPCPSCGQKLDSYKKPK